MGALGTWRLATILERERIARPIRRFFGEREDAALGGYPTYPDTFFGYLISCFKCLSVWCGLFVLCLLLIDPRLVLPLALSAAAILLQYLEYKVSA